MAPTILLDVDNVICNFTGAACREIAKILDRDINPLDATDWDLTHCFGLTTKQAIAFDRAVRRKGFCANLALLPGAERAVNKLALLGHITFVTSPWIGAQHWMYERERWIWDRFSVGGVIHTRDKGIVRGDVIIDDHVGHVRAGQRKLRVLVPNAANARWRKIPYMQTQSPSDRLMISKSWPKIIDAVRGVE